MFVCGSQYSQLPGSRDTFVNWLTSCICNNLYLFYLYWLCVCVWFKTHIHMALHARMHVNKTRAQTLVWLAVYALTLQLTKAVLTTIVSRDMLSLFLQAAGPSWSCVFVSEVDVFVYGDLGYGSSAASSSTPSPSASFLLSVCALYLIIINDCLLGNLSGNSLYYRDAKVPVTAKERAMYLEH